MAVFHLSDNCVYTLNGAPAPRVFERDDVFALTGWKQGCAPVTTVVRACSPRADGLCVTDFCNGHFLLSLSPSPLCTPSSDTLQCVCSGGARHLITAYCAENAPLTVETDGEYYSVVCPVRPEKLTAACARVGGGDLIRITVCGEKQFCLILYYDCDYRLLLRLCADEVTFCDDGVSVVDRVGGMLSCTVTRRLVCKGGRFAEVSRKCDYASHHRYPDGLIGRLYLYKRFYRDPDCAQLIAPDCQIDVDATIGDFERVFDSDFSGAKRGVVCVADREQKYCRVRRLLFSVRDGYIRDVRRLPDRI